MVNLVVLLVEIKNEFPNFGLESKSTSLFMKILNALLLIITLGKMKTFMTKFTTTIGYTVYTPNEWDQWSDEDKCSILRHERVHMQQRRTHGSLWFSLSYLLLPLPAVWAYYRMKYEMEAYEESIRIRVEYFGLRALTPEYRESLVQRFTGASYVWTWPWRKRIEKWYDEFVTKLSS